MSNLLIPGGCYGYVYVLGFWIEKKIVRAQKDRSKWGASLK